MDDDIHLGKARDYESKHGEHLLRRQMSRYSRQELLSFGRSDERDKWMWIAATYPRQNSKKTTSGGLASSPKVP